MKGDLVQSILEGRKVICLAITEPTAGSDVAGIQTVARQTVLNGEPGFIVRGTKKWITNSMFADYFTTLVKTVSPEGKDLGTSMLLVEKSELVVVRSIPTNYSLTAGTGLVSFEDVFVPQRNLLGKIGQGFQITMHNFNMERWGICAMVVGRSRRIIEESFLWATTREAFGKRLIDQPVIQQHLGSMMADFQATYSQYEKLTHQYNTLSKAEANAKLGGPTGLLKYKCTRMSTHVSDLAVQILGGRGVTKTGMGKNIERNMKSFKLASVYGGSEEICITRIFLPQALKQFPKNARL
jgi:alkylation response protein AidB-like acyl-CoA dehydrogenase